jgi:hypothetical protein
MELMKPYQTLFKKTPKKGREKEIRGKEQSPGKQIGQKANHKEVRKPLSIQTSTSRLKNINKRKGK